MRDLTVKKLHEITGGRLRLATLSPRDGEETQVGRIVTDSRQVQRSDVFWGLSGTRFDGANFAEQAYARGAAGAVVGSRYVQPAPRCWSLEVPCAGSPGSAGSLESTADVGHGGGRHRQRWQNHDPADDSYRAGQPLVRIDQPQKLQ